MKTYEQFLGALKKAYSETMEQNRRDVIRYIEIIQEVDKMQKAGEYSADNPKVIKLKEEVEMIHERKLEYGKKLKKLRNDIEKLNSMKEETKTLQ